MGSFFKHFPFFYLIKTSVTGMKQGLIFNKALENLFCWTRETLGKHRKQKRAL